METVLACITFFREFLEEVMTIKKQSNLKSILIFMAFLFECASLAIEFLISEDASLLTALHFKHRYIV
jgi:hypothetical protein